MSAVSAVNWICEDEDDVGCACSLDTVECCCVGEVVRAVFDDDPLKVECKECGERMVAIDIESGERLSPQPKEFP